MGRREPGRGRHNDRLKLAVRTEHRQDVLDVAAGGMQAYDELVRDRPGVEPFPLRPSTSRARAGGRAQPGSDPGHAAGAAPCGCPPRHSSMSALSVLPSITIFSPGFLIAAGMSGNDLSLLRKPAAPAVAAATRRRGVAPTVRMRTLTSGKVALIRLITSIPSPAGSSMST